MRSMLAHYFYVVALGEREHPDNDKLTQLRNVVVVVDAKDLDTAKELALGHITRILPGWEWILTMAWDVQYINKSQHQDISEAGYWILAGIDEARETYDNTLKDLGVEW